MLAGVHYTVTIKVVDGDEMTKAAPRSRILCILIILLILFCTLALIIIVFRVILWNYIIFLVILFVFNIST
jgi:hypothetical protein